MTRLLAVSLLIGAVLLTGCGGNKENAKSIEDDPKFPKEGTKGVRGTPDDKGGGPGGKKMPNRPKKSVNAGSGGTNNDTMKAASKALSGTGKAASRGASRIFGAFSRVIGNSAKKIKSPDQGKKIAAKKGDSKKSKTKKGDSKKSKTKKSKTKKGDSKKSKTKKK